MRSFVNQRLALLLKIALACLIVYPSSEIAYAAKKKEAQAAAEPYGLDAMQQFERLPYLKLDTVAGGASSYDRDGGNDDGFGNSNFLYTDEHNDKVMLDLKGSGTIYRMWFTGYDQENAYVKIYFDGEETPRIDMKLKDMFSGTNKPFLAPLVLNDNASSGGFVSYLPLPFEKSIKITTNGPGHSFFYNIGYHMYSPGTEIKSWTGSEDSVDVREMWNSAGTDPKDGKKTKSESGTVKLQPGSSKTLLNLDGPRSISSIKLNVPGVAVPIKPVVVTDDGRAHKGYSRFVMAIDPGNSGVTLKRRLDYNIADQKAAVYVDDAYVGEWYDAGRNGTHNWKDSAFDIPSTFTEGKSSITVKVEFISSAIDWNEFHYWAFSEVNGEDVLTDALDVANEDSEREHGYEINRQAWNGTRSFTYPPSDEAFTDEGREHKGYSRFDVAIDPGNQGVVLRRRFDYGTEDQRATVSVDGKRVGDWENPGSNGKERWKDSEFYIPPTYTKGKDSITVEIDSKKSWTEYTYWIYSINGNGKHQTDQLDIGDHASESSHDYEIKNELWSGELTSRYLASSSNVQEILNDIHMEIYWDGESDPSVNAPLGSLFAMGQFGPYDTKTVPVGMDENNNMYMYFPMPFEKSAKIKLVNEMSDSIEDISYEITHKPFKDSFENVGYFKTSFQLERAKRRDGKDLEILDVEGSGHFVGVVQSLQAVINQGPVDRWHLEGDERIYVDGSQSPIIHGTGTEDFYNAGWYFNRGLFTTPTAGYTAFTIEDDVDRTAMYRLFIHDTVPFRKHFRMSIEHGHDNEIAENVWMLAYYYHKPEERAVLTDTLDVGSSSSEEIHSYVIEEESWSGSRTLQYEGDFDDESITDDGRAHKGYSQFTMEIKPENEGVLLRRRFDQIIANQTADVYVDGELVGTWYRAGGNNAKRWRDEDFMIPASFTKDKEKIEIKVEFVEESSDLDWNEFQYQVYTLVP